MGGARSKDVKIEVGGFDISSMTTDLSIGVKAGGIISVNVSLIGNVELHAEKLEHLLGLLRIVDKNGETVHSIEGLKR